MHNLHHFLLRSFMNTNKTRTLRLRLHNIFDRDALEAGLNLQVQVFTHNFRKGVRLHANS